jgi:hypothetical protein
MRAAERARSIPIVVTAMSMAAMALAAADTQPALGADRGVATAPAAFTTTAGTLGAIAMTSASNGWAVGLRFGFDEEPLILRWNGSTWTQQPLPRLREGWLSAIAASSARNAWAVGGTGEKNLILHWNGKRWSRLPCPTPHHEAGLVGVTVTKSGAAWAVGFGYTSGGLVDVILRWTGGKWKQAANPAATIPGLAAGAGSLAAVAASSDRNAWVVGTGAPGIWTVAAHWTGSVWRQSPMPDIYAGLLESVAVASRHQAWAVGGIYGSTGRHSVLIMHWNGHSWRRVRSPNPPGAMLESVAALSNGTAWAVGMTGRGANFILFWNGHSWRRVASPDFRLAGVRHDSLTGVSAVWPRNVWAVGHAGTTGAFIMSWNGSVWQ